MATVSLVIETDGFQHAPEAYTIKSIALAIFATRSCLVRVFDTSHLIHGSSAALRTYHYQSEYHGLTVDGVGLPQEYVVPLILGFLQEAILDELERGLPPPLSFILWTKGADKRDFFQQLLDSAALPPPIPIIVRNLKDLDCPPAQFILGFTEHPTMEHRAVVFARWLAETRLRSRRQPQ